MFSRWQASEDIPFWIQLFLLAFVLLGLVPGVQKFIGRIERFFRALAGQDHTEESATGSRTEAAPADFQTSSHLNEYEYIVFRRLARAEEKGMSSRALSKALHLSHSRVESVLQALADRGLVTARRRMLLFERFYLTSRGRDYALEQGFIVRLHRTGSS